MLPVFCTESVFAPLLASISSFCLDLCRFMFPAQDCFLAMIRLLKVTYCFREKQTRVFFSAAFLEGKGSRGRDGRLDSQRSSGLFWGAIQCQSHTQTHTCVHLYVVVS